MSGPEDARFNHPCGIAASSNGALYVADSLNNTVRQITSAGPASTLAWLAGGPGTNDGTQSLARFNGPAVDGARDCVPLRYHRFLGSSLFSVEPIPNTRRRRQTPEGVPVYSQIR